MNDEQLAQQWFMTLDDEAVKQLIVKAYRDHLKHVEELKALGFKWGVDK